MTAHRVAITGAAVLSTIADDLAGLALALRAGRTGIAAVDLPPQTRTSAAALLPTSSVAGWAARHLSVDRADHLTAATSTAALPARTGACVAMLAADAIDRSERADAALIVAGNNLALHHHAEALTAFAERPGRLRPSHALTHLDTDVVGAVSEVTGVRGEGCTVGGASASGTVALIHAARLVAAGERRACLIVAPVAELAPAELRAFQDSGAMADDPARAPSQLCRPFDVDRSGFVYGQAAAAVVVAREDPVRGSAGLAGVVGWGQQLDGRRGTAPDPGGQAAAMRAALHGGRTEPADVDYVNAHGSGSVAGDAAEAVALREVFGPGPGPLVNSTKPFVGHCLAAAGLVEVVATLAQMRGRFVHGNPNTLTPLEGAPRLAGRASIPRAPRLALVNSVAFSGINAAVLLRAADP